MAFNVKHATNLIFMDSFFNLYHPNGTYVVCFVFMSAFVYFGFDMFYSMFFVFVLTGWWKSMHGNAIHIETFFILSIDRYLNRPNLIRFYLSSIFECSFREKIFVEFVEVCQWNDVSWFLLWNELFLCVLLVFSDL